jgi:hypothetical protein
VLNFYRNEQGQLVKSLSFKKEYPQGLFTFLNDTSEIIRQEEMLIYKDISIPGIGDVHNGIDPFECWYRNQLGSYVINGDTVGGITPDSFFIVSTQESFHEDFILYLNPTNGQITLDFNDKNHGNINLQIMDAFGKKVHQQLIQKGEAAVEIDLEYLPKGIYFMLGEDAGKYFSEKIIRH